MQGKRCWTLKSTHSVKEWEYFWKEEGLGGNAKVSLDRNIPNEKEGGGKGTKLLRGAWEYRIRAGK